MKDNLILAVSVSHNFSAALMRNGEIVTAAFEEGFCRQKNYVGYPKLAIDYCLQKNGVSGNQLGRIAHTIIGNSDVLIKAKTNQKFTLTR